LECKEPLALRVGGEGGGVNVRHQALKSP